MIRDTSRRPTIKDIARLANCSISTVSRALNDSGRISRQKRAEILEIAKRLNYIPSTAARTLARNRSFTLGLVISDITNVFYAEMIHFVQRVALAKGYLVHIVADNDDPKLSKKYVDFLMSRGIDGIIFGSARLHDTVIDQLIERKFPVVLVNRRMERTDLNSVCVDNVLGAYVMTQHLIGNGYERIAFISGDQHFSPSVDRLAGYKQALGEAGIPINDDLIVVQDSFRKEAGINGIKELFAKNSPKGKRPDAIFAVNDTVALGVLEGAWEMNLAVPHDLAVTGFDDNSFSALKQIQLTTMSQRLSEIAELAVEVLIESIGSEDKRDFRRVILSPTLQVRRSCGAQHN